MPVIKEQAQSVDESKNPKGEKIVFSDRIKVKATKNAKHLTADEVYELHPIAAKKLIKKGAAVEVK